MLHIDAFMQDALPYALHRSSYECNIKGINAKQAMASSHASCLCKFYLPYNGCLSPQLMQTLQSA